MLALIGTLVLMLAGVAVNVWVDGAIFDAIFGDEDEGGSAATVYVPGMQTSRKRRRIR